MTYSLRVTTEPDEIRPVMMHPRVWPWVSEDCDAEWRPDFDRYTYLLCGVDGEAAGVVQYQRLHSTSLIGHYAFLPKAWGEEALHLGKAALAWGFVQMGTQVIVGIQPTDNRRAIAFTRRLGFQETGLIPKACMRGGVLRDMLVFTLTRKM